MKVTKFKKMPNIQILEFCNELHMRHTLWSCLVRCANMKGIQLVLWKIQSGHDIVHRRTDRSMDWQDGRTDGLSNIVSLADPIPRRISQGFFWVWGQPKRRWYILMYSLADPIPRMISDYCLQHPRSPIFPQIAQHGVAMPFIITDHWSIPHDEEIP